MRLVRFGSEGSEKPGILFSDGIYDVSEFVKDYNEDFFQNDGVGKLRLWVNRNIESLPKVQEGARLGPPVSRPSKIICIGLNYEDHARETDAPIPKEPIIFFKSSTALCGPNDNIMIPKNSKKTDWEVELAVVIGKKATYVSEKEALNYVVGYALHNDYSEREFQLERGGQWVKGKSHDSFAPLGPFLTLKDEIKDINNLKMWLKVNGKTYQDSNTSNMIFKVPFLIHYLSQFMTLLPGDIISTGTPAGVGMGLKPSVYLKEGDEVELFIEGLGSSKQVAVAWSR